MRRWTRISGSTVTLRWLAIFLAGSGSDCFLHAQPQPASADSPSQIVFLLPVAFKGWVCADFGVPGALPLPREGDGMIIRARPGEIVKTSDKTINDSRGRDYFSGQAWWEDGEHRQPLPEGFRRQGGSATRRDILDGRVVEQECAFFGSREDRNSAGEPPSFRDAVAVSAEERQILMVLYGSTGGMHWKNNNGWLGPAGSECNWYGVRCQPGLYSVTTIDGLELSNNNLVGAIPEVISRLKNLGFFDIFGNHLSGTLPNTLIQRWLAQQLDLGAEDSLLTSVSDRFRVGSVRPPVRNASHYNSLGRQCFLLYGALSKRHTVG